MVYLKALFQKIFDKESGKWISDALFHIHLAMDERVKGMREGTPNLVFEYAILVQMGLRYLKQCPDEQDLEEFQRRVIEESLACSNALKHVTLDPKVHTFVEGVATGCRDAVKQLEV